MPWLSYRFIRWMDSRIEPTWKVLEFGSGMSTPWLAARCKYLHSIEADPQWYKRVSRQLEKQDLKNVCYELRSIEEYAKIEPHEFGIFDLAVIDGDERRDCLVTAIRGAKPGGWIYLDDTDLPGKHHQPAEDLLIETANRLGKTIRYFRDFSPGSFFVCEGALLQMGSEAGKKLRKS